MAGSASQAGSTDAANPTRRSFIGRVGVGTAIAWSAPAILATTPAAAQGTAFPLFMAVGGDGDGLTFASSDAGATWPTTATTLSPGVVHAVAFGDDTAAKWIAVGNRGTSTANDQGWEIWTSTDDGASWSSNASQVAVTGRLTGVATDGAGTWLAVGQSVSDPPPDPPLGPGDALVVRSTDDGATWSEVHLPAVSELHGVATNGSLWVAAGQVDAGDPCVVTSADAGATWSAPAVLGASGHLFNVATNWAGDWMVAGMSPTLTAIAYTASSNATTGVGDWTAVAGLGTGLIIGLASDRAGGNFVGVGRRDGGGGFSYTFTGGGAVAGTFDTSSFELHEVATDLAGTWVAVGVDSAGGQMCTHVSVDAGATWTETASPTSFGILLGVAARVVA